MSDDDNSPNPAVAPELEAMRRAMKAAEDAAEARRLAKHAARRHEEDGTADSAELDMLAELAMNAAPFDLDLPVASAFKLSESNEVADLVAALDAVIPDDDTEERDGDLILIKNSAKPSPWYKEAAEEALPSALKDIVGPIDVKTLLQALLVEIGDVKRTNALLLERLTRMEEKVDRTNRHLKDRRY